MAYTLEPFRLMINRSVILLVKLKILKFRDKKVQNIQKSLEDHFNIQLQGLEN